MRTTWGSRRQAQQLESGRIIHHPVSPSATLMLTLTTPSAALIRFRFADLLPDRFISIIVHPEGWTLGYVCHTFVIGQYDMGD